MKKILALILVAALAVSMAACGEKAQEVASSVEDAASSVEEAVSSEVEAVESTVEGAVEAAEGNKELPELDGYTKTDNGGFIMYTNNENPANSITVTSTPADATTIESFTSKDETYINQTKEAFAATASAMGEGVEISEPEFATIEGKEVLVSKVTMKANPDLNIAEDITSATYTFVSGESFCTVTSMNASEADVNAVIAAA